MNILILIGENKCPTLLQPINSVVYGKVLSWISWNCKFLVKWLKRGHHNVSQILNSRGKVVLVKGAFFF